MRLQFCIDQKCQLTHSRIKTTSFLDIGQVLLNKHFDDTTIF